jgi:hypothetical protein
VRFGLKLANVGWRLNIAVFVATRDTPAFDQSFTLEHEPASFGNPNRFVSAACLAVQCVFCRWMCVDEFIARAAAVAEFLQGRRSPGKIPAWNLWIGARRRWLPRTHRQASRSTPRLPIDRLEHLSKRHGAASSPTGFAHRQRLCRMDPVPDRMRSPEEARRPTEKRPKRGG